MFQRLDLLDRTDKAQAGVWLIKITGIEYFENEHAALCGIIGAVITAKAEFAQLGFDLIVPNFVRDHIISFRRLRLEEYFPFIWPCVAPVGFCRICNQRNYPGP